MHNVSLKDMMVFAWDIQPFQISGGPPWLDSIRYEITAIPANRKTPPKWNEMSSMIQLLLADQFQLSVHRESRELAIYSLALARKDGRLGPGLQQTKDGSCTTFDPSKPLPPPEPGNGPRRMCGNSGVSPVHLSAIGAPIANVVPLLSQVLGRKVVDMTGLTGNFDVSLSWTPDETQAMQWQMPPGVPVPPPPDASGPSIFTAIQEQLGLKLESTKGPVDVLIVDHAEKAVEN